MSKQCPQSRARDIQQLNGCLRRGGRERTRRMNNSFLRNEGVNRRARGGRHGLTARKLDRASLLVGHQTGNATQGVLAACRTLVNRENGPSEQVFRVENARPSQRATWRPTSPRGPASPRPNQSTELCVEGTPSPLCREVVPKTKKSSQRIEKGPAAGVELRRGYPVPTILTVRTGVRGAVAEQRSTITEFSAPRRAHAARRDEIFHREPCGRERPD